MIEAFNLLKEEEGAQFVVREARWKQLVKLVAPDISNSHRELLLRISDDEQKSFIGEQWVPAMLEGLGRRPRSGALRVLTLELVICNGPRGSRPLFLLQSDKVLKTYSFCLCCSLCQVCYGQLFMAIWYQAEPSRENMSSCSQHRTRKASLVIRLLWAVWLCTQSSRLSCSVSAWDESASSWLSFIILDSTCSDD